MKSLSFKTNHHLFFWKYFGFNTHVNYKQIRSKECCLCCKATTWKDTATRVGVRKKQCSLPSACLWMCQRVHPAYKHTMKWSTQSYSIWPKMCPTNKVMNILGKWTTCWTKDFWSYCNYFHKVAKPLLDPKHCRGNAKKSWSSI